MATPKKQKNGNWRVQVYLGKDENGKRITRTVTAPTKKECTDRAIKLRAEGVKAKSLSPTVREVVEKYVESIEGVASPTTIRGYRIVLKNYFPSLMEKRIDQLTDLVVQEAVSEECGRITQYGKPMSPKSVRNGWGLIEVALRKGYGKVFPVKLPQEIVKIKEFPMPGLIIQAVKGTDVELPVLLAMWLSLSMSEIRGLDCSAVRNGVLHIEKVRIDSEWGEVEKPTGKVGTRIRNHRIPPYIMGLIEDTKTYRQYLATGENAPLVPLTRNVIYKHWKKIAVGQGWEMSFHDLRAVSASVMLLLGIPDKYAMQRGGWKTDTTYKRVYQQTFDRERQAVDDRIDDYFAQFIG